MNTSAVTPYISPPQQFYVQNPQNPAVVLPTDKETRNLAIATLVFVAISAVLFGLKYTVMKENLLSDQPLLFNRQTYPRLPLGAFMHDNVPLNFNKTVGGINPNSGQRRLGRIDSVPTYK